MKNKKIYVTNPSLAPLDEYIDILKEVWETGILTHNGPLVQKLEKEICLKIGLKNFISVSNGTIALQMAIKALDLKGEIITTPFTWIATISAIKWEGCTPIFCDIDKKTLNIDPNKIERLITENTVAIMPVHVFGNPCDIIGIEKIAKNNNLKVIYDAAHAVGSTYEGRSILEFGDISATSLHATKILNTAEGGGCITTNSKLNDKLKRIRFFGHNESKDDIVEDGFNGKMTEVHAALGLANIKYLNKILSDRISKSKIYYDGLRINEDLSFQEVKFGQTNSSYFPLIFKDENQLLSIQKILNKDNIFPRRYFFPSVNLFNNIFKYHRCNISENIANRILCLPLYYELEESKIRKIIDIVNESL